MNQTCSIYPMDNHYLARSSQKSVLITSEMLAHCTVYDHGLCLVPEHTRDTSETVGCAVGLADSRPVSELRKLCAFRCIPNTELIVQEVDTNLLIVTNALKIATHCPSRSTSYMLERKGAAFVRLQCNCSLLIDEDYVVDPPMFCALDELHPIYLASPNLWTRFDNLLGWSTQFFHSHSNQTFDETWTSELPFINVSTAPYRDIPDEEFFNNVTYKEYWMFGLSVAVAVLFIFQIHLCCIFSRI